MKTSVMVFHPNIARSRVNAALMERAQNEPELDLVVRDMYALYPDFHINVEEEQRVANGADRLVFQFPFYWYSAPALMKQWEDEVLSSGWAYGPDARIAGKRMMLAVSTGGLEDTYAADGTAPRWANCCCRTASSRSIWDWSSRNRSSCTVPMRPNSTTARSPPYHGSMLLVCVD